MNFADIAFSSLQDKAPAIVDHLVGFQVLDVNDDQDMATGVYGARSGDNWIYLPVFYRRGVLQGNDLMYLVNQDLFVPLDEPWVLYALNLNKVSIGGKSHRNYGEIQRDSNYSLWDIKRSPFNGKVSSFDGPSDPDYVARAAGRTMPCWFSDNRQKWASLAGNMVSGVNTDAHVALAKKADMVTLLNAAGPDMAARVLSKIAGNVKFAAAMGKFYGPEKMAEINRFGTADFKKKAGLDFGPSHFELSKVRVIRGDGLATAAKDLGLSDSERRRLLRGEYLVKDDREDTSIVVRRSLPKSMVLTTGNAEGGVRDVVLQDGRVVGAFVLPLIGHGEWTRPDETNGMHHNLGPIGRESMDKKSIIALVDDKGGYQIATPGSCIFPTSEILDPFNIGDKKKRALSIDQVSAGKDYLVVFANGQTIGGIHVTDKATTGGLSVVRGIRHDTYCPRAFLGGADDITLTIGQQASNTPMLFADHAMNTVTVNRYSCRFIPVEATGENDVGDVKTYDAEMRTMPSAMFDSWLQTNGMHGLRLASRDGEYDILDEESGEKRAHSRFEALNWLTKSAGIHGDTAVAMLADADREPRTKVAFYVKRAAAYTKQALQRVPDDIGAPAMQNIEGSRTSASTGLPASQTSDVSATGYVNTQYEDANQVYNQDPSRQTDPSDIAGLADGAARTGQKELFDVSVLMSMVDDTDVASAIEGFIGDMMLGMDRDGRAYFILLQHTDEVGEVWGENDIDDLRKILLQSFKLNGRKIMELRRRWEKNMRTAGNASTDS